MADSKMSTAQEDQLIDSMVARAVEAAAKGESVDQLMEVMAASISMQAKEKLLKKFTAALAKRKLKPPSKEPDISSQGALARIRNIFALTARQAFDRVLALVRARPDVDATIKQAGRILLRNGVILDRVEVTEADLGAMAPMLGGPSAQQDRTRMGG